MTDACKICGTTDPETDSGNFIYDKCATCSTMTALAMGIVDEDAMDAHEAAEEHVRGFVE